MKQMTSGKARRGYGEVLITLATAARKKRKQPLDIKILAAYPAEQAKKLVGELIVQLGRTYLIDNIEVMTATTPEEAMQLIRENPDLPLIVSGLDPNDTFALTISIREMEAEIRAHFTDETPSRNIIAVLPSDPKNPFVSVYTGINDVVFVGPPDNQSVLSINKVVGFLAANKEITSIAYQNQLAICYRHAFENDPDPTSSGDDDELFCTTGSSFLTSGISDRELSYSSSSSDFSESSSITSPGR